MYLVHDTAVLCFLSCWWYHIPGTLYLVWVWWCLSSCVYDPWLMMSVVLCSSLSLLYTGISCCLLLFFFSRVFVCLLACSFVRPLFLFAVVSFYCYTWYIHVFVLRLRHHHHKYRVESVRVVWSEPSPPPDVTTNPELFDHPRPVRIQRYPTTSINNRLGSCFWWIVVAIISLHYHSGRTLLWSVFTCLVLVVGVEITLKMVSREDNNLQQAVVVVVKYSYMYLQPGIGIRYTI